MYLSCGNWGVPTPHRGGQVKTPRSAHPALTDVIRSPAHPALTTSTLPDNGRTGGGGTGTGQTPVTCTTGPSGEPDVPFCSKGQATRQRKRDRPPSGGPSKASAFVCHWTEIQRHVDAETARRQQDLADSHPFRNRGKWHPPSHRHASGRRRSHTNLGTVGSVDLLEATPPRRQGPRVVSAWSVWWIYKLLLRLRLGVEFLG